MAEAEKCRNILESSIVREYQLLPGKVPAETQLNVLDIPASSGLLSEEELEITDCDATKLTAQIAVGQWSAEAVTIAYLKRATIGHQTVNVTSSFQHIVVCL